MPLLEMEPAEDDLSQKGNRSLDRVLSKALAVYSMLVGICIGTFLHLATLGGSFVMLTSVGIDVSSTTARLLAFGLSFAISLVAFTLSSVVRFLLGLALQSSADVTPSDSDLAYVRLCNLLGLVAGIFAASVSTEAIMDGNSSNFVLHTIALVIWVVATLAATERRYAQEGSDPEKPGFNGDDNCGDMDFNSSYV